MKIDKKALKVKCDDFDGVVRFFTADGREAFSIHIVDGHTLEICGGSCIKDDDIIYSEGLEILPKSRNSMYIKKSAYEMRNNKWESEIWQILAPILDDCYLQSLRDMDDPNAEGDGYDAERIEDYRQVVLDLANWLTPKEKEIVLPEYPEDWEVMKWASWKQRQKLRSQLLSEFAND